MSYSIMNTPNDSYDVDGGGPPQNITINSICDVSTIFAGGGPSATAGAKVMVGGKQLVPSPFMSLTLEKYKVGELTIGGVLKLTLNGTVTGSSFGEVVTNGAGGVTGLEDILRIGQYKECVYVKIECGPSAGKIVDGYGRVTSISIPEGNRPNWVNMAPYTIEIDLYTNNIDGLSSIRPADAGYILTSGNPNANLIQDNQLMLKSVSESFSVNIQDEAFNWIGSGSCSSNTPNIVSQTIDMGDRHIKVNFNISAAGIRILDCEGNASEVYMKYGLRAAEIYVADRIEKLRKMDIGGLFSSPPNNEIVPALSGYAGGNSYANFRTLEVNPLEDSLSVNGEIIYRPTGCAFPQALTSINIEENVDAEGAVFTITGNIKGLINNSFDKIIKLNPDQFQDCKLSTKITNAESVLTGIQTKATGLAACYYTSAYLSDTCQYSSSYDPCSSPSPSPSSSPISVCDLRLVSRQISRNLSQGEINFNYVVSNKANCNILGAKKVDVEVTHDIPHDNIVEILIPGRGNAGVITQNLCCKSVEKYETSVNIVLNTNNCNNSMPSGTLANLRQCAENILKNKLDPAVQCWFVTNHQESEGNNSYKLSKTYVKPSC